MLLPAMPAAMIFGLVVWFLIEPCRRGRRHSRQTCGFARHVSDVVSLPAHAPLFVPWNVTQVLDALSKDPRWRDVSCRVFDEWTSRGRASCTRAYAEARQRRPCAPDIWVAGRALSYRRAVRHTVAYKHGVDVKCLTRKQFMSRQAHPGTFLSHDLRDFCGVDRRALKHAQMLANRDRAGNARDEMFVVKVNPYTGHRSRYVVGACPGDSGGVELVDAERPAAAQRVD